MYVCVCVYIYIYIYIPSLRLSGMYTCKRGSLGVKMGLSYTFMSLNHLIVPSGDKLIRERARPQQETWRRRRHIHTYIKYIYIYTSTHMTFRISKLARNNLQTITYNTSHAIPDVDTKLVATFNRYPNIARN